MRKIIVGSRKSKLALTQTNWVINQLKERGAKYDFEIKEIVTKGDVIQDVTLSKVGGKGLFVKEIEQAIYDSEVDMAVHSMKDMPAILPGGLIIGCTPKRVDPRDVLISKNGETLNQLPNGAIIGTSSLRRAAQLLSVRPDLEIKWIRGNVDTRLRKLQEEDYSAIILAAAGLERLGFEHSMVSEFLDTELMLPAVGQGCLAIECRESDVELQEMLQLLHDEYTSKTVETERVLLHGLEGSCQVPVAGYAVMNEDNQIMLTALVSSRDGSEVLKEIVIGDNPQEVGKLAVEKLLAKGAKALIEEAKKDA